jgi:hypothetical protein
LKIYGVDKFSKKRDMLFGEIQDFEIRIKRRWRIGLEYSRC